MQTSARVAETKALSSPPPSVTRPVRRRERGESIGRYVILDRLGAGGMGMVYAAYDPALDRRVAVKLLLPEMVGVSEAGRARLLREAQAMAKLNHANVVAVHDAGEADGHVYVAMECIEGTTLRSWLRRQERSLAAILRAFVDAGRGLAAAHRADIVHRDFKPDNVMVDRRRQGDRGAMRVVVMDFGLAHAVGSTATDPDVEPGAAGTTPASRLSFRLTEAGAVIGTPAYMPPEQIAGLPTDPRTDQYAFCVSLWEALHGTLPFAGKSLPEFAFAIAERRFEPSPRDASVPRALRHALIRGLAADPADRFESMDALLEVLVRYGKRPRHARVGAAALGGGALLFAAVPASPDEPCTDARTQLGDAWDDARREVAKAAVLGTAVPFADAAWRRASAGLDAYAQRWVDGYEGNCVATRRHASQSVATMDLRQACLMGARRELDAVAATLGRATLSTVEQAHRLVASLPDLRRCDDLAALRAATPPPDDAHADAVTAIEAHLASARAALAATDAPRATAALAAAESKLQAVDHAPTRVRTMLVRGALQAHLGEYDAASETFQSVRELASADGQWDAVREATLGRLNALGHHLRRTEAGRAMFDLARGLSAGDPRREAEAYEAIASVLIVDGDAAGALAAFNRALQASRLVHNEDHPQVVSAKRGIAMATFAAGDYELAAERAQQAVTATKAALGEDHPQVASALFYLTAARSELRDFDAAEASARESLAILERVYPEGHPKIGDGYVGLAGNMHLQSRFSEAERLYAEAIRRYVTSLGPAHAYVAVARSNRAKTLAGLGRFDEAIAESRTAVRAWLASQPASHANTVDLYQDYAQILSGDDRYADAAEALQRAWDLAPADLPGFERGNTALAMAEALRGAGASADDVHRWAGRASAAYAEAGERYASQRDRARALAQDAP